MPGPPPSQTPASFATGCSSSRPGGGAGRLRRRPNLWQVVAMRWAEIVDRVGTALTVGQADTRASLNNPRVTFRAYQPLTVNHRLRFGPLREPTLYRKDYENLTAQEYQWLTGLAGPPPRYYTIKAIDQVSYRGLWQVVDAIEVGGVSTGTQMDSFRAQIDIDSALAGLERLSQKLQKKVIRKGLRAGGKIWLAAVKAAAPVRSGNLKRAIKLRAGPRRKGASSITVGARRKDLKVRPGDQGFYPASVEYGHKVGHRGGAVRPLVRALSGRTKSPPTRFSGRPSAPAPAPRPRPRSKQCSKKSKEPTDVRPRPRDFRRPV